MDPFNLHAFNNLHHLQQQQTEAQRRKKTVNDVLDKLSAARSGHGERRTAQSKFEEDYLKPPPRHHQVAAYTEAEENFEHLLDPGELQEWKDYKANIQKAAYDAKFGKGPAVQDHPLVQGSAALDGVGESEAGSLQALLSGLKRSKTFEQRVSSLVTRTSGQLQEDNNKSSGDGAAASNNKPAEVKHGRRSRTNDGIVLHGPSQYTNVLQVTEPPTQPTTSVLPKVKAVPKKQLSQLQLGASSGLTLPSPRNSSSGQPFSPRQLSRGGVSHSQHPQAVDASLSPSTRDAPYVSDLARVKFQLTDDQGLGNDAPADAAMPAHQSGKESNDGAKVRDGPLRQSSGSIKHGRRSGLIEAVDSGRESPVNQVRRSATTFSITTPASSPSLFGETMGSVMAAQIQAQQKFFELVGGSSSSNGRGASGHFGRMSASGTLLGSAAGAAAAAVSHTPSPLSPRRAPPSKSTSGGRHAH